AYDGMAKRSQVHADLMGPSGINIEFQQAELAVRCRQTFAHPVVSYRRAAAATPRCHAGTAHLVATDAGIYGAAVLLHPTVDQGDVLLLYLTARKLFCQPPMPDVVLCNHHQAAGFLVEAMNNSGTQFAAHARQGCEMMQQRVD